MLVLSRELEQEIVLIVPPGETERRFSFKIGRIDPHKVRLVFHAPRDVVIRRRELQDNIDDDEARETADLAEVTARAF